MSRLRPTLQRSLCTLLVAAGLMTLTTSCVRETTMPEWKLIWQDEFDGPAGQSPSARNWRYDVGTDWGNAQLEYDTARPVNASLDGAGHLALTARKEAYLGRNYTSARINTLGLFEQARGRFEARIKMPSGRGLWPAFWMLGSNFAKVGWPQCGEIDIMEYRGQEPGLIHGSLHGPGFSGGGALTRTFELGGARFDDDFHVFAVEWSADRITWFVDGSAYESVTPENLPSSDRWVFNQPFFIILNVAVGGNYVGPPGAATAFPQTMTVDYVRVYGVGS